MRPRIVLCNRSDVADVIRPTPWTMVSSGFFSVLSCNSGVGTTGLTAIVGLLPGTPKATYPSAVCLRIEKPTLGAEIELRFLVLPGFGPNADTIQPPTAKSSKKLKCSGDNNVRISRRGLPRDPG
jgi:hypothetical protein